MEDRSFLLMKLGFVFVAPLAGFIFSYFNFPTSIRAAEEEDEEDEAEEWSCRTSACCVAGGCGRGLKYELFLMQNEVDTTNIIHRALMKSATMSANNIPSNAKRSEDDDRGAVCSPKVNRQAAEQETVCGRPNIEVKMKSASISTNNIPSNSKRSEDDERRALCSPEVNRQAAGQETDCGRPNMEVKMKSATMGTNNIPSNPKRTEDDKREALCSPEVNRQAAEQETVCRRPYMEVKIVESEVEYLRNLAESIWENNRTLAAVRELQDQLKANSAEIQKLKGENERLKSEASEFSSEFSAMKRDLESSKSKVKQVKLRLRAADEQAKEKIASLEHKIIMQADADLQNKMLAMLLKELEDEAAQVRKEKAILEQRLESADLSISTLENSQAEVSKEMDRLREINSSLEKTIEQLHSDRAAQSEELVYLRRKQLILRYAEEESSSSPESQCQSEVDYSTAPAPFRDSPPKAKKTNSRKSKFLDKIKKLVLRKRGSSEKNKINPAPDHQVKASSDAEEETAGSRYSFDSNVSCFTEEEEEEEDQPAEDGLTNNESMQKL